MFRQRRDLVGGALDVTNKLKLFTSALADRQSARTQLQRVHSVAKVMNPIARAVLL
jgi:hypothetical protein